MDITKFEERDNLYPVSKIAANEWKSFALYTVESRAIPNMIDGLKPVQRFYLYSSIKNTKNDFKKVSAVSGVVSDYGYNHGEQSAASAGQLMAAEWSNNICLVEGRGSFGTRLVQAAAAPRYTYTKLHQNFQKYILDLDLAPKHYDPEHEPPAFYIPVIPLVLVNGIKGIATGFATNILPRDPEKIKAACEEYVKTGKIKKKIPIKFPHFNGNVTYNDEEGRYYATGKYELKGKTVLLITEIPYGFDREEYIGVLDKLEERGDIVGYDDLCDKEGFKFQVKLKQQSSATWSEEKILKEFKLSKVYTENITVISPEGKLKEYVDERDLIIDFCEYRKTILQARIDMRKQELNEENRWLKVKMEFIESILNNKIIFKNRKKEELTNDILSHTTALSTDVEKLLRLNIVSLTVEMISNLKAEMQKGKEQYIYWDTTTVKDQFLMDLGSI